MSVICTHLGVFNKINSNVLKVPCLHDLSMLCLSEISPTADELNTFLTNLLDTVYTVTVHVVY